MDRMTVRVARLALAVASLALLPLPASAQIPVTDVASLKQQIIHYAKVLQDLHIQTTMLKANLDELRFIATNRFSAHYAGSWLRSQLFSCDWSRDYNRALNFGVNEEVAYLNSTLRSMTSGCVIDQWPEHLQSLERMRKKLDMANVYAIQAIGTSSTDLRREDETIGHLIAASMANGELDRTTTALLQKTTANTATALAVLRGIQRSQDAVVQSLLAQNNLLRDQIVERLNSETARREKWDGVMEAFE
jgi:hypothetical protein